MLILFSPAHAASEFSAVYVVLDGKVGFNDTYHRPGCSLLVGEDEVVLMTLGKAKQNGYRPCGSCKPDDIEPPSTWKDPATTTPEPSSPPSSSASSSTAFWLLCIYYLVVLVVCGSVTTKRWQMFVSNLDRCSFDDLELVAGYIDIWPTDYHLNSMKWSAFRHAAFSAAAAAVIWFVNIKWISTALLVINALYGTWAHIVQRQRVRNGGSNVPFVQDIIRPIATACSITTLFAIIDWAYLFLFYALRP